MATTTVSEQRLAAQQTPSPTRMTWEEFLAWGDEETWAEWVDGEVEVMTRPSTLHQLVIGFLNTLLEVYLMHRPVGKQILELLMRLPERPSGRVPDMLFLRNEHLDRLQDKFCDGPADVVIEITSPETEATDRGAKFREYEAAGVTQYWLIDPLRQMADFYRLGEDGLYDRIEPAAAGRLHSAVLPGFQLDPDWLWRDPTPALKEALAWVEEMAGA